MTPIAIIAFRRLGPSNPAITIASTIPGNANMMSTNRIAQVSTQPPKYPEMRPQEAADEQGNQHRDDADLQ